MINKENRICKPFSNSSKDLLRSIEASKFEGSHESNLSFILYYRPLYCQNMIRWKTESAEQDQIQAEAGKFTLYLYL